MVVISVIIIIFIKKNVKIKKFFKGFIPRAKVSVVYNVVFCNVYAGMLV